MTFPGQTIRLLAVTAALIAAVPAHAALLDRGPQDPTLVFPQWYRDLNGTALGLCKSQAPSPNAALGAGNMCFPTPTDPNGFAGNLGPELFYSNLNVLVGKGAAANGTSTFALRYIAALEASYLPAGVPIHGTETVFARIRIVMNAQTTGRYTVTHPYGVEVFDVTDTGPRAVFFTADVPLATMMNFDDALGGRIGPFIEWDAVEFPLTLNVGNEVFLGDPNIEHTFKGSPFNTNYVEVVGPVGSDLDGAGNNIVKQTLGLVVGQKWTAPIATAFKVDRAVYATNTTSNIHTIDVWASSAPNQKLVLTAPGLPSLQLKEYLPPFNVPGTYYGHIEIPTTFPTPSGITVTNLSGAIISSLSTSLVDQVDIAVASFDPLTRTLTVSASTSDMTGPALVVEAKGYPASLMTPGVTPGTASFVSAALGTGVEPPPTVRVVSAAGGVATVGVVSGSGNPDNLGGTATAVSDGSAAAPINVAGAGPTALNVVGNDLDGAGTPFSAANPFTGSVLILSLPSIGTAVANADGTITYTPKIAAQGTDSFTYAIQTAAGISNVATVTVTVPFTAPPPVANADNFAMLTGTSRTYNVLVNDVAGTGTALAPSSVRTGLLSANGGSTVANADGTITYRPRAGFTGIDTFTYTVSSNAVPPSTSTPATVTVSVFGGAEAVSFSKLGYAPANAKWTIVGSTNWFNTSLTQTTATCYLTVNGGVAQVPFKVIGSAPVDTTGKFQLVATAPPAPVPTSQATVRCITSNGGFKDGGVVIK